MSDLINRQDAIDAIEAKEANEFGNYREYNVAFNDGLHSAVFALEDLPTADVREVVHGRNICDSVIGHCEFKCSVCGADALSVSCGSLDGGKFNYCPNCGADMRGDEDDGR